MQSYLLYHGIGVNASKNIIHGGGLGQIMFHVAAPWESFRASREDHGQLIPARLVNSYLDHSASHDIRDSWWMALEKLIDCGRNVAQNGPCDASLNSGGAY